MGKDNVDYSVWYNRQEYHVEYKNNVKGWEDVGRALIVYHDHINQADAVAIAEAYNDWQVRKYDADRASILKDFGIDIADDPQTYSTPKRIDVVWWLDKGWHNAQVS